MYTSHFGCSLGFEIESRVLLNLMQEATPHPLLSSPVASVPEFQAVKYGGARGTGYSILGSWTRYLALGLDTRSKFCREFIGYFGLDTRHTGLDTRHTGFDTWVDFLVSIESIRVEN